MISNNTPTSNICAEKIFNSFVWFKDEKIYLSQKVPAIVALFLLLIMPSEVKIVYAMKQTTCECGGKLHKHEIKEWKMNKIFCIYKQRYKCKSCRKTITTPLNGIVDKYCNYTSIIINLALKIDSIEHTSYKNKAKLFNSWGLNIHRSTVFLHKKKKYPVYSKMKHEGIEKLLKEKNMGLSGVYNYDEEFLGNKNQKFARLSLIDANTGVIINDQKIPKELFDSYFMEIFIKYSLKDLSIYNDPTRPNPRHPLLLTDLKKEVIVTDGDKAYPKILEKLGVEQHLCIFHKIMNQRTIAWKQQRRIKRKQKSYENKKTKNNETIEKQKIKGKGKTGRPSKKDTQRNKQINKKKECNTKNKKYRKKIKKLKEQDGLYEECNTKISEIFQVNTLSEANRKFNTLYNRRDYLPEDMSNYIENLKKDQPKLFNYLENDKIPKTNNLIEGFYKHTMEKYYKKRFITSEGIDMFLDLSEIRWYEEVVFGQEIEIPTQDIWKELITNYSNP